MLRELIDARLLTSYEVEGKEGEPSHHRVEVVHESLLKAWPRLVRWQAQEEDGAVLRDQLKQAAHLWEEKGRTSDLLWTGTAYREFELWRERYPGALTALEEDFARALADKARRKRRIIRAAVAAVVLVSTGVSIAIAVSRHQAVVAAQRAEASKLLALAQVKLQEDPTEALAYTTASLELADTREARLMALRALQEAPPAWDLPFPSEINPRWPAFSPDGQHLAVAGFSAEVGVWRDDGSPPLRLPGHETSPSGGNKAQWASTELLVTGLCCGMSQQVHVWSLPRGTKLRTIDFGRPSFWGVGSGRLFAETPEGAPVESFVGGGLLSVLGAPRWRAGGARSRRRPQARDHLELLRAPRPGVALHEGDDGPHPPAARGSRRRPGLQPSCGEGRVRHSPRSRSSVPARRVRREPSHSLPGERAAGHHGHPEARLGAG